MAVIASKLRIVVSMNHPLVTGSILVKFSVESVFNAEWTYYWILYRLMIYYDYRFCSESFIRIVKFSHSHNGRDGTVRILFQFVTHFVLLYDVIKIYFRWKTIDAWKFIFAESDELKFCEFSCFENKTIVHRFRPHNTWVKQTFYKCYIMLNLHCARAQVNECGQVEVSIAVNRNSEWLTQPPVFWRNPHRTVIRDECHRHR